MSTLSAAPASSKRHSLNVSTSAAGPRPFHLLDINASPSPNSAPLSRSLYEQQGYFPATPPLSARPYKSSGHPRRQSSISYNSIASPREGGFALARSNSAGTRHTGHSRRSTGSGGSIQPTPPTTERAPLTLVEKNAELLHFIAQKESKCLELRSQLAVHEAELLQLKRKWERIVSRGFDASSAPASITPTSANGAIVLDGIREGVQGVGRIIAAGLGELSSPPLTTTPLRTRGHVANQSNSSTSTRTTNTSSSTRLSQSSVSSVGDFPSPSKEDPLETTIWHGENVDSGHTPTTHQHAPEKPPSTITNGDFFAESEKSVKALRRRSLPRNASEGVSVHARSSERCGAVGAVSPRAFTSSPMTPPMSRTPSSSGANAGWLGTAGKKWEEIQSGATFTNSQKRASLMLSDVSQSIASALLSPPMASSPLSGLVSSLGGTAAGTRASSSLLDDDEDMNNSEMGGVLQPSPVFSKPILPKPRPYAGGGSGKRAIDKTPAPVLVEDDDDWNW